MVVVGLEGRMIGVHGRRDQHAMLLPSWSSFIPPSLSISAAATA